MTEPQIDFAWGRAGLAALRETCDVFVIIDVLCFSTSVDVAVARGAEVLPFPLEKYGADEAARRGEAVLARPRKEAAGGPSLSPASLASLAPGTRLLLPSPNGSALSAMVQDGTAFAASLALVSDFPWDLLVLGAAPGSITEMALTARFLNENVALITAFHLVRIFLIIPNTPWMLKLVHKRAGPLGSDQESGSKDS